MHKSNNVIDLKSRRPVSARLSSESLVEDAVRVEVPGEFRGQIQSEFQTDFQTDFQADSNGQMARQSHNAPLIVDMTERRERMVNEERRELKRTILTEFIGAFIVVPERGLQRVSLHDISENGLAFDLDLGIGAMAVGEEVAMRVYLNHQSYFPFTVRVQNVRQQELESVHRHGVSFVKGSINDQALHHFVKFIETVSLSLRTDYGDVMVSGLGR